MKIFLSFGIFSINLIQVNCHVSVDCLKDLYNAFRWSLIEINKESLCFCDVLLVLFISLFNLITLFTQIAVLRNDFVAEDLVEFIALNNHFLHFFRVLLYFFFLPLLIVPELFINLTKQILLNYVSALVYNFKSVILNWFLTCAKDLFKILRQRKIGEKQGCALCFLAIS